MQRARISTLERVLAGRIMLGSSLLVGSATAAPMHVGTSPSAAAWYVAAYLHRPSSSARRFSRARPRTPAVHAEAGVAAEAWSIATDLDPVPTSVTGRHLDLAMAIEP